MSKIPFVVILGYAMKNKVNISVKVNSLDEYNVVIKDALEYGFSFLPTSINYFDLNYTEAYIIFDWWLEQITTRIKTSVLVFNYQEIDFSDDASYSMVIDDVIDRIEKDIEKANVYNANGDWELYTKTISNLDSLCKCIGLEGLESVAKLNEKGEWELL